MMPDDSVSPTTMDWTQLRQTFAHLGEGVSIFDADYRLVLSNERAIDLSGIPQELVKPGVHLRDFLVLQAQLGEFGPCDPQQEADRRIAHLQQHPQATYERSHPDGRIVEVRRSPLPGGGILTIYLDVTAKRKADEQLQVYKFVVNSITDVVSVMDVDMKYLFVNDAFCRVSGWAREDLIGKHHGVVSPEAMTAERRAATLRCLQSGEPQVVDAVIPLEGRAARHMETTYFPFVLGNNQVGGVVQVSRDNTQRVADALRAREDAQFIRLIADNIPGMLGYWTRNLHCRFANSQYLTWFGRTAQEMQGIHIRELMGETVYALNEPYIQGVLAGQDQKFERTLVKPSGEVGHTWARYIADKADDQVRGFFVMVSDITEIKQQQLELTRLNAAMRVAAIAFEGQKGMLVTDAAFRVLRINSALAELSGLDPAALGDRDLWSLLSSGRNPLGVLEQAMAESRDTGQWAGEFWWRKSDREEFPAAVSISAVADDAGCLQNFVVTVRDVSEDHQREQQREVAHAAQRNALVREVHHRIKNNLQGVTGLLAQFGLSHPDMKPILNQAIAQVLSVATIHGLQGRSGEGGLNLLELVESIAQQVRQIWGFGIVVRHSEDFGYWFINPNEAVPIALILNELLSNAAKHADPQDPELTLQGGYDPGGRCVRIGMSNRVSGALVQQGGASGQGLRLVASLLPREGAACRTQRQADRFESVLELAEPVVSEHPLH